MTSNEQPSVLPLYFVLSDSHGTFVPSFTTTSSHQIIVKYISGLRWLHKYDSHLSAMSQIQTRNISSHISSSKSIILLIGTNSIRSLTAQHVLHQVEDLIILLRNHHPHLHDKTSINIVAIFPCLKLSFYFDTYTSLQRNIHLYNQQLLALSNQLNFTVLDFHVKEDYISNDTLHLDFPHRDLVKNSIFHYFENLTPQSPSSSNTEPARSIQSLARRNERKQNKLEQKQQLLHLTRSVSSSWTLNHAKQYLRKQKIKFAKLPPKRHNILRIQFNNSTSLHVAEQRLPEDIFSQEHFFEHFSS